MSTSQETKPTPQQPPEKPPSPPPTESKERLLPPTTITVILAPHSGRHHALGLREHLKPGTIFIPELSGWDELSRKLMQKVADGKHHPVAALSVLADDAHKMRPFLYQVLEEIYNTKVKVMLVDTQKKDPLNQAFDQQYNALPYQSSFPDTLQAINASFQAYDSLQTDREQVMVNNLVASLQKLKGNHHQLVMTLGAFHDRIIPKLQEAAAHFQSLEITPITHPSTPQDFSYEDEARERIKHNEVPDNEFLAKALLETLITQSQIGEKLSSIFQDMLAAREYARKIVAQFSFAEIQSIYEQTLELYTQRVSTKELVVVSSQPYAGLELVISEILQGKDGTTGWFAKKGIVLPEPPKKDRYFSPFV